MSTNWPRAQVGPENQAHYSSSVSSPWSTNRHHCVSWTCPRIPAWRRRAKLPLFLLTTRVERTWIPPHPAENVAVDSGEISFPTCSEHGTGRMEAVFDSSRGRCRGLLLYDSAAIESMSMLQECLQTPSAHARPGSVIVRRLLLTYLSGPGLVIQDSSVQYA